MFKALIEKFKAHLPTNFGGENQHTVLADFMSHTAARIQAVEKQVAATGVGEFTAAKAELAAEVKIQFDGALETLATSLAAFEERIAKLENPAPVETPPAQPSAAAQG